MIRVSFLSKLIRTASNRPLEVDDLGVSSKTMRPSLLYNAFEKEWEKECVKEPKKRSLLNVILRSNGLCYWSVAMMLNIVAIFLNFIPTIILNLFVKNVEEGVQSTFSFIISFNSN